MKGKEEDKNETIFKVRSLNAVLRRKELQKILDENKVGSIFTALIKMFVIFIVDSSSNSESCSLLQS